MDSIAADLKGGNDGGGAQKELDKRGGKSLQQSSDDRLIFVEKKEIVNYCSNIGNSFDAWVIHDSTKLESGSNLLTANIH